MTISLQALLKHIDQCPFAWSSKLDDGKILVHKGTSQEDILAWLKKLDEYSRYVKEQEMRVLDITSRVRGNVRTM